MSHCVKILLQGLAVSSLVSVCTCNCTYNAWSEPTSEFVCQEYVTTTINVNCTFEDDYKSYLDGIYHRVGQDGWIARCNDGVTLFLTKPFKNASLTVLVKSFLESVIPIKNVYLNELGISAITSSAFDSQSSLKVVHLRTNNLTSISGEIFDKLDLEELDLSENYITSEKILSHMTVKKLILSKNHLVSISHFLSEVENLDVSFNKVEHLVPSTYFNTIILNVSSNQISDIDMPRFRKINELYLANNKIENISIDTDLLRILDVSNNNISLLPKDLKRLVVLNASGNRLSKFVESSINGSYLKELYLCNNTYTNISNSIFKNTRNLRILDLSNNIISSFTPGWSDNLLELRVLNISFNNLSMIPAYAFKSMAKLKKLHLNGNNISKIPNSLFRNLKSLVVLDLSENFLSSFSFGTFDGLQALKTLNISYNKFKVLPLYTFHAMKHLENLYFNNNELSEPFVLLRELPHLKRIDFRENTFTCYLLLIFINELTKKKVYFESGTFIEDNNVYGIKCLNPYESENSNSLMFPYSSSIFSNAENLMTSYKTLLGDISSISTMLNKTFLTLNNIYHGYYVPRMR